jgi:DNA-directed RNA polymerase specialized sigma24 family protein
VRRKDADDAELLLAAAGGDDRAFAVFYRRWLPVVTGYHLRRVRSRELAFDLTAETFTAVVTDLRRFDPDRGSAPGWLFEIAEHKLLDSWRRARVENSARARLALGSPTSRLFWTIAISNGSRSLHHLAAPVNSTHCSRG